MANQDMRMIDLLLVAGTSLRIPGTKDIMHNFSAQLGTKASGRESSIKSIFINMEKVSDAGWAEKYFDAWVQGDCQQFASILRKTKGIIAPAVIDGSLDAVKEY